MKLSGLLQALPQARAVGPTGLDIRALCYDSRQVEPGALFVAIPGASVDGHEFVAEACRRGARAVMAERAVTVPEEVCLIEVPESRAALSRLSACLYDYPSERIAAIGLTGTNGKTTTAYALHSILRAAGRNPALLTTVEEWLGQERTPARLTTPESLELQGFLARASEWGHQVVVMEVSSQGLVGHRVDDVHFQAAVFTNLAPEHLDVHKTMAAYGEAKALLFRGLDEGAVAVLNADEEFSQHLGKVTHARPVTYGMEEPAQVQGRVLEVTASGSRFTLTMEGERRELRSPLLGRHNAVNCLAAAATAWALGVGLEAIAAGVEALERVPGRLERVDEGQPFTVLVDYAHTDHALANVLKAVAELTAGRIIVVFGCGGDRDRSKRPRMGTEAERLADVVWVTNDNPRSEDPLAVIEEILGGVSDRGRVHVEADRARAITQALTAARPGDLVLIAGKGHETYQIIGSERRPFDDRVVAAETLRSLGAVAAEKERSE